MSVLPKRMTAPEVEQRIYTIEFLPDGKAKTGKNLMLFDCWITAVSVEEGDPIVVEGSH